MRRADTIDLFAFFRARMICLLFLPLFLFAICCEGQDSLSRAYQGLDYHWPIPRNARIALKTGEKLKGGISRINDSLMVFLAIGDVVPRYCSIRIDEISSIRIKRNGVARGVTKGAAIGFLAGYGAGYLSYTNDPNDSDEENRSRRDGQAVLGAVIGLAPGAFVGILAGAATTKRNFVINGKRENLIKMISKLE